MLGYSLGDEINYYMDPVVEKLGWDVNYDGRLDEKEVLYLRKLQMTEYSMFHLHQMTKILHKWKYIQIIKK